MEKEKYNQTVLHAAHDYDLPLHIVQSIYNRFGEKEFYSRLEEEIKIRINSNIDPNSFQKEN